MKYMTKLQEWIEANHEELWRRYIEYIDFERDSIEAKNYMINSEACFEQWCEEQFADLCGHGDPCDTDQTGVCVRCGEDWSKQ